MLKMQTDRFFKHPYIHTSVLFSRMNVPYEAVYPAVDNVLFQFDFNVREQTRTTEDFESVLKMQTDCSGRGFSTADRKF